MRILSSTLLLTTLCISSSLWAHGHDSSTYCHNRPATQKVLQLETAEGGEMTLDFGEEEPSLSTSSALLCTTPSIDVTEAILWMPGMGHGSAPTTVTPSTEAGCFVIDDIDFLMPGHWQIKIQIPAQNEEIFNVCI